MGNENSASFALLSLLLLSGILLPQTIQLSFSQPSLGSGCKEVEREALLQFKQNLTDPSGRLLSWVGEDCCSWRGVGCNNRTGNIIMLNLNNPFRDSFDSYEDDAVHELRGEISPSLLQLKDLEYLDMSLNNFKGVQLPEFIGSLKELRYLNLSGSFFSGIIPQSLGNLSNLLYLDLNNFLDQSNQIGLGWLSGLSSLKYLNLGGVDLSNTAAYWLEIFSKLPSIVELHLPNCNLPILPIHFPSLNFTSLQVLDLSNNGFNSTIPHWLFNITNLLSLDLNSNDLQGDIPDGFASLNSLQLLDLSGNSFLEGQLSRNLGTLCNLQTLKLSLNQFRGEVSDFIDGLSECINSSSLARLELGYNQLTGNLPISLGYLKNLRYLELWYNSFLGSIPPSIGNLTFLQELYLTSNQMNGKFPESFGQLSAIRVLELSDNQWEGFITEAHLRNLTSLEELSLIKTSNSSLSFNISFDWIPPFKLRYLVIRYYQLGPKFPTWLRNQTELTTLVLNGASISDTLPSWFWQLNLTLDELDVGGNHLSGRIPNTLVFRFPGSVDLSSNRFDGPLPLWSSNLTKLYLRDNLFSGPIPNDLGQKTPFLTDLDISFNSLNGSIPQSVGNLKQLLTLVISNNNLSGGIPQFLKNISSLYILDMTKNNFSGEIPESIGSLLTIRFLVLSNNHLSGEIPPSLKNCSLMDSLDLGENQLSGNIPAWIGESMPSLSILRLRSNHFNGTIPSELCKLSALHILDLSHNNLSGPIPHCVGDFSAMKVKPPDTEIYQGSLQVAIKGTQYVYQQTLYLVNLMDLSRNNLSGEMPVELTSLLHLGTLNLSGNQLVGKIPTQIGKLEWLESVDLSRNKLSGSIPPSMVSIRFLSFLNLSFNNLSGEIPTANQFQTLINPSIYEGNLALCGVPLPKRCSEIDGTPQIPGADEDKEDENGHDKLWLFVSVGLGFIMGFWGVCGTLIIKKSWRYAYFQFFDKIKDQLLTFLALSVVRLKRKRSEKNGAGET
ncbi:hypothetical protein AB3S75_009870 [Citrus x aurantiifolia]